MTPYTNVWRQVQEAEARGINDTLTFYPSYGEIKSYEVFAATSRLQGRRVCSITLTVTIRLKTNRTGRYAFPEEAQPADLLVTINTRLITHFIMYGASYSFHFILLTLY